LEIGEPVNEPAADQAVKKLVTCLIKLSEEENVYGKLDARIARDDSQVHSRRTPTVQQKLSRIEHLVREDFEGWKSKFSEGRKTFPRRFEEAFFLTFHNQMQLWTSQEKCKINTPMCFQSLRKPISRSRRMMVVI
jgi:hypothetical protein